jgi:hypothetical protein
MCLPLQLGCAGLKEVGSQRPGTVELISSLSEHQLFDNLVASAKVVHRGSGRTRRR